MKYLGSYAGMFLAMMCSGLFALTFMARAGSGDVFAPLSSIRLYGSVCNAQAHEIDGAAAIFVCEFDQSVEAGLAGMPRFSDEVMASLSLLQKNLERNAPLKRQAVHGIVSKVRLYDGTECLNSGQGAMLAFDGKRLNFSCTPGRFALIGPLQSLGNTLLAERVVVEQSESGFKAAFAEIVPVQAITVDVEGSAQ